MQEALISFKGKDISFELEKYNFSQLQKSELNENLFSTLPEELKAHPFFKYYRKLKTKTKAGGFLYSTGDDLVKVWSVLGATVSSITAPFTAGITAIFAPLFIKGGTAANQALTEKEKVFQEEKKVKKDFSEKYRQYTESQATQSQARLMPENLLQTATSNPIYIILILIFIFLLLRK